MLDDQLCRGPRTVIIDGEPRAMEKLQGLWKVVVLPNPIMLRRLYYDGPQNVVLPGMA